MRIIAVGEAQTSQASSEAAPIAVAASSGAGAIATFRAGAPEPFKPPVALGDGAALPFTSGDRSSVAVPLTAPQSPATGESTLDSSARASAVVPVPAKTPDYPGGISQAEPPPSRPGEWATVDVATAPAAVDLASESVEIVEIEPDRESDPGDDEAPTPLAPSIALDGAGRGAESLAHDDTDEEALEIEPEREPDAVEARSREGAGEGAEEDEPLEEIEPERDSVPEAEDSGDDIPIDLEEEQPQAAPKRPPPPPPRKGEIIPPAAEATPTPPAAAAAAAASPAADEPAAPATEPRAKPAAAAPPLESLSRRRQKPWWEDLFGDDFIRTMDRLEPRQISREVDFIEESLGVEKGAVILDLACGAGQHAVELASRGYSVVGYDLSLAMLARAADEAQDRGQKINFLQGDMREMAFEEMFDGVYCWSTSFGYFDDEKNIDVLMRTHRSLRQGGMLLLETANRDYVAARSPSLVWFEGDGCVCMDEMHVDFFSSRLKVKRTSMFDDGRSRELDYSIRLYSLHELGKMLHDCGFKVVEVTGHPAHPGVFFGAESPRVIILAERS